MEKLKNYEEAKKLWQILGDVSVDIYGNIEQQFLHFEIGTDRLEIWLWFEEKFNLSVAKNLMYNERTISYI